MKVGETSKSVWPIAWDYNMLKVFMDFGLF